MREDPEKRFGNQCRAGLQQRNGVALRAACLANIENALAPPRPLPLAAFVTGTGMPTKLKFDLSASAVTAAPEASTVCCIGATFSANAATRSQAARQYHCRGENPSDVRAVRRRLKHGENFRHVYLYGDLPLILMHAAVRQ